MSTPPALAARGVVVERGDARVLDGLDLAIPGGASLLIRGESGVGKTTLFYVLGLLESPDDGTVVVDGTDAAALPERRRARVRRDRVGFVFQDFQLVDDLTAWENARLPQEHGRSLFGDDPDGEAWLREVFDRLGIAGLTERYPAALSGGERQRVAIARAVANRPTVILADEPTGQLDPDATEAVLDLLLDVREAVGAALVVVSHDVRLADAFDDEVRLVDGTIERTSASG